MLLKTIVVTYIKAEYLNFLKNIARASKTKPTSYQHKRASAYFSRRE